MRKSIQLLALLVTMQCGLTSTSAASAYEFAAYEPGTIVVKTSEHKLYYLLGAGQTLIYPVAVGRAGRTWTGVAEIDGKYIRPAWSPPSDVRRNKSSRSRIIPGGAPSNPMGAAALTLTGGEYAIHGTNAPKLIGQSVSDGCIRMHNRDIMDLYRRVKIGTPVIVTH